MLWASGKDPLLEDPLNTASLEYRHGSNCETILRALGLESV
jgi:hypothetical protein